jgi:hypothetical protein
MKRSLKAWELKAYLAERHPKNLEGEFEVWVSWNNVHRRVVSVVIDRDKEVFILDVSNE